MGPGCPGAQARLVVRHDRINDVWRQIDWGNLTAVVGPAEFADTYRRRMEWAQRFLKGMVILYPYYVQERRDNPVRRRMDEYSLLAKAVAVSCGALFVDVQEAVDAALRTTRFAAIAADRVHPTAEGHALIARAFLGAVESDVESGRPGRKGSPGESRNVFGPISVDTATFPGRATF